MVDTIALTPEDVQKSLEWAGATLLSMNLKSPLPNEPQSAWPAYASEPNVAYGYSGERLRPGRPSARDIAQMDQILALVQLTENVLTRRLLNARALVSPVSNRYLYSWAKLAFMLHSDRRKIVRIHYNGLREIVDKAEHDKIYVIRQSLSS